MIGGVLNHLWQSTWFAAAAWLACFALRRRPARVRHAIWLAASLKFLVPFALLTGIGHDAAPRRPIVIVKPEVRVAVDDIAAAISFDGGPAAVSPLCSRRLPWIWGCGFVAFAARSIVRWQRARAVVRAARPIRLACAVEARVSRVPVEPALFGFLRPVLLLPEGIAERLSPAEFRAIVAHELCHAHHHDNLAGLLHTVVESIFWFHPLVWLLGARLVEERERACDEEVLRLGNEPEVYAGSILNACRLYLESPAACVSAATGADLRNRVERILTGCRPVRLGATGKLLLASAGVLAIVGPLVLGLLHAQGRPAFDVASVKWNQSGERMGRLGPVDRARFSAVNIPLPGLVATAYDVHFEQISGGPTWFYTDRFDVEAKPEHPTSRQEIGAMLQTLLEDRFHLVVKRETREEPVYALVGEKGGPRLKSHVGELGPSEGGFPIRPGDHGHVIFTGVRMERLAWFLGTRLGRPVIDRTGLAGSFDFELAWDGDARPEGLAAPPRIETGESAFSALRSLGLKLESQRGPVERLTIVRVEHPTGN